MGCGCDNKTEPTHLYVISFTVLKEAGLALVAAKNDKQAFQILQNSGSRNCHDGGHYALIQIRDIGMTADCHYGLLMESFVNALEAYAAIMEAANKLVGPKGDRGETGEKGNKGDSGELAFVMFSLNDNGYIVYDSVNASSVVDFTLDDNGNICVVV